MLLMGRRLTATSGFGGETAAKLWELLPSSVTDRYCWWVFVVVACKCICKVCCSQRKRTHERAGFRSWVVGRMARCCWQKTKTPLRALGALL
jgi:hypothetical protein